MDFNQLRYIVEIVEMGSITKAANNLFISQPNLSSQITNLEREIGKEIFLRTNRGVSLTTYGVEIYHQAKSMVQQFEMIEKRLLKNTNDNKIKISSFGCEVINHEFLKVCKSFNDRNYEFELYQCSVEESIQKLINRDVDLSIIIFSQFQYKKLSQFLANEKLEMKEIFKGELKIHISEKWNLSKKESISSYDLKDLLHVKKAALFQGMFSLDYELNCFGIAQENKTMITHGNKIYEDTLREIPSFAVTVDWKCPNEINTHMKRVNFEDKELIITCACVNRKNEILKEELQAFLKELEKYE
ncbi:MAG: LysR family transcriptional regulator [Clostridium sp.]